MPHSTLTAGQFTRREAAGYIITFTALLSAPAVICFFRASIDDPDVWWHLSAGQWILRHGTWPTIDTFSTYGAGNSWTAYSWLPELILYGLYQWLGLRGLLLYTAGLSAAIVIAFSALTRRLQQNTLVVIALTLTAALGLISIQMPRPWLFSILFFVIELDLLLTAGRTGRRRLLLWLVPLFVVWANMHIQFVLGLVVLGLAVVESLAVRVAPIPLADDDSRRISPAWMLAVFALSAAATLINPYHYHLYEAAAQLLSQQRLWNLIQELKAMPFRSPANWTVLAVTLLAAFGFGWRRRVRLLLIVLFTMAAYCSFRSQRDAWFVLLVGLAGLAYVARDFRGRWAATAREGTAAGRLQWAATGIATVVICAGSLLASQSRLEEKIAQTFPVGAAEFIRHQQCSGPMFNTFTWGGYLIFSLPEVPVSIDGRTMVHGEERVLRHAATLRGRKGWRDDPELAHAGLIVLPRHQALTTLLKRDARVRLIYEDSLAVVFDTHIDRLAHESHQ